jgi:DNA excision repair protein ERCC-3
LISEDTKEVLYATKRRSFLVDQGYSFQTVKYCNLVDESTNLMYSTKEEQLHLLSQVVAIDSAAGNIEDLADEDEKEYTREKRKENQRGKRKSVDVSSMTGGTGRVYQEFSNRAPKSRLQLEREREQKRLQSQTQKLKFQKESLIAEAEAEKKILAEKAALEAAKKA